jgi:hypothetical protein
MAAEIKPHSRGGEEQAKDGYESVCARCWMFSVLFPRHNIHQHHKDVAGIGGMEHSYITSHHERSGIRPGRDSSSKCRSNSSLQDEFLIIQTAVKLHTRVNRWYRADQAGTTRVIRLP